MQSRRCAVERAYDVSAVEQFAHEIGADETGAPGHEHPAEFCGQRCVTHGEEHN